MRQSISPSAVAPKPDSDLAGPDGPPLNEKEAAQTLGVCIPTFQRGVEDGVIPPPMRIGRLKLYPRPFIWALRNGGPPGQKPDPVNSAIHSDPSNNAGKRTNDHKH